MFEMTCYTRVTLVLSVADFYVLCRAVLSKSALGLYFLSKGDYCQVGSAYV